jgi:phenylacetate-CoA ligase
MLEGNFQMLGELIRRTGFWILDYCKGGSIRKHYTDIEKKMKNEISPQESVDELLKYAVENVPFYYDKKLLSINEFPVMTKEKYTDNGKSVRSTEFSNSSKLHWVRTSGSTGTPFSAPQDRKKRNRTIAELLYFHKISGWNLGDKYLFIRAWVAYNASLSKRIMNNFIPFEATNFNEANKRKLLNTIKKEKSLKILFGYSSVITDLAEFILDNNENVPNAGIKLVVVDSDTLLEGSKEKIEAAFGCPLMNRYDNEEHGLLACMKPGDDYWTVNTASYYIELLKIDNDEQCEPGETGRVVVTDLTNRAMPFIRYDVGDLACSYNYNGKYATRLDALEGKANDIIKDTSGNRVGNVSFAAYFELFMPVKKYQLIQESKKQYCIKVILKEGESIDKSEMVLEFKKCLGNDADIRVDIVDEIETTKAGKYRPVISMYNGGK